MKNGLKITQTELENAYSLMASGVVDGHLSDVILASLHLSIELAQQRKAYNMSAITKNMLEYYTASSITETFGELRK